MKLSILVMAGALLCGCASAPIQSIEEIHYTATRCEKAGVDTKNNTGPMLPVHTVNSRTVGGVYKGCNLDPSPSGPYGSKTVYGCIIESENGWDIYHSGGTSKVHELCHAKFGPKHNNIINPW
jgi:hypothetical protein